MTDDPPRKPLPLRILAPLCWGIGCAVSFAHPGDEYGHYFIGSIAGSWIVLLVGASSPPLASVLVTGCAVLFGLGWLLDRLGTNRLLWGLLWAAIAVTLFIWSITEFPSLDAAIAKNGSVLTYVASSSQLGITAASLLAVVVAVTRRAIGAARST